jgi:hypothetical protein
VIASFIVFVLLTFFALAAVFAARAVCARPVDILPALGTDAPVCALYFVAQRPLFFLNPPNRAFLRGCTRWIVFIARRAKP